MRTRVADIIRDVGTTPQVFYGYFPTKLELFIECLEVLSEWSIDLTERRVTMEPDTAKHAVLRAFGYLGLREISPDLLRLARAEAMREGGESKRVLYKSYDDLVFTVLPDSQGFGTLGAACRSRRTNSWRTPSWASWKRLSGAGLETTPSRNEKSCRRSCTCGWP